MSGTPKPGSESPHQAMSQHFSTKLAQVAELARAYPQTAFKNLNHHLDRGLLEAAVDKTNRAGAPGIDGQTAAGYALDLEGNLNRLIDQAKSGRYRAPAVRRVEIPKGDGKGTRKLGLPTYEDKVLQRAVTTILESIYEQDFLPCSYGFRPGRSAHDALQAVWDATQKLDGCWIIDADIKSYFDTIPHQQMRELLQLRVRDGVLLRLIGKWLNAGVMEAGATSYPTSGTPQGGVISPLLANVYLHHVLDLWFEQVVRPCMRGAAFLVRYADDFVVGFKRKDDADRFLAVLSKRFGRFGLTIHPEKTRLVDYRRPDRRQATDAKYPTSFDFLGFTHTWGRSRKGRLVPRQMTAHSRFTRSLKRLNEWCRLHRHDPIDEQWRRLCPKIRGHINYFGITGNMRRIAAFVLQAERIWHKWINRRSQRRSMPWTQFQRILAKYSLPPPRLPKSVFA